MFFYKILYWLLCLIFKPQAEVRGLENLPKNRGFILAANHENVYDPLVIAGLLKKFIWQNLLPKKKKVYFLANPRLKTNVMKYSLVSLAINLFQEKMGYLPANILGLRRAINLLKEGNAVVVFPEGHRNPKKYLLKGRKGVAVMALAAKTPVIPAGCFGPPARTIRRFLKGLFQKKKVIFGPGLCLPSCQPDARGRFNGILLRQVTDSIMMAIARITSKYYQPEKPI